MSARDLAATVLAEPVLVKLRRVSVRTDLYASEAASLLAYVAALERQAADAQDSPNLRAAFAAVDEDRRREKAARVRTEEALRVFGTHFAGCGALDGYGTTCGCGFTAALAAAGADTAPPEDAWERPSFCRAPACKPCVSAECRCREEA